MVAGLNNIIKKQTTNQIMEEIEGFANTVLSQSQEYHPEVSSTFCMATLFYPPQLTWFPSNGPCPYPEENNKRSMMIDLNEKIMEFNEKIFHDLAETYKKMNNGQVGEKSRSVKFHKYGLRKQTLKFPNGKKVPIKSHRWEHWRESEPRERMLHLNNNIRAKMGRSVGRYFEQMFKVGDDESVTLPE